MIEDYTDNRGHLIWERDSDRVTVDAIKKHNKADAAVERITSGKKYKAQPGEYFITELKLMRGEDWPTLEEWAAEEAKKRGE